MLNINNTITDAIHVYQLPQIILKDLVETGFKSPLRVHGINLRITDECSLQCRCFSCVQEYTVLAPDQLGLPPCWYRKKWAEKAA